MFPSLGLTLCGFIFTVLISIVYFSKKRYDNFEDKVYSFEIILTIIMFVLEFVSVFTMYYRELIPTFNKFACSIYVLGSEIWFSAVILYSWGLGKNINLSDKRCKKIIILLSIISIIGYILFLLLPVKYTSGSTIEFYAIGGDAVWFLYIIAAVALVFIVYSLIRNKGNVPFIKRLPIFLFLGFFLIATFIQPFTADINDLTYLFSGYIIVMYFALENQDSKLVEELKNAKKEVEIAAKQQTDFLSTMSHEIRTPMNAIIGFSDSLLSEEKLTKDVVIRDVTNINKASNELLAIINNILDISRIESGKETIEYKEYKLSKMIERIIGNISNKLNDNVVFELDVNPNIPDNIIGDEIKISKILSQILTNSIINTSVGKVVLKVDYELVDESIKLKFIISDTGIGIKEEDYSKVFEKFVKLNNTDSSEGTGLGLVITKSLVDLLGGTITFDSIYGKGTNFYVNITQKYINSNVIGKIDISKIDNKIKYFNGSKYNILVVDDSKLNLKIIERLLEPYKFKVKCVSSGKECIEELKKNEKIHMILLDHMLPEMDGIETLEIIKKMDIKKPFVIALTANASPNVKNLYINKGFDDYIAKPVDIRELNELLKKYFVVEKKEGDK